MKDLKLIVEKKTRELVKIIARISWIGLQYPREQKQEFKY